MEVRRMTYTISKKPPKSLMFNIPFFGERRGYHPIKFRLSLLAGTGNNVIISERHAIEVQERAQTRSQRWVTRRVRWSFKSLGTNYGEGTFRGYLIYGIPFKEVMDSPKRKKGWEPGNRAGNSFWFG